MKDSKNNELVVGDTIILVGKVKAIGPPDSSISVLCSNPTRSGADKDLAAIAAWKADAVGRNAEWIAANPCPQVKMGTTILMIPDSGLVEKYL